MYEWEDWRYLYRKFIYAETSGPTNDISHILKCSHGKVYEQKIPLLSEIASDTLKYEESKEAIKEMLLVTFNLTHRQCLTQKEFQGYKFTLIVSYLLNFIYQLV